MKKIFLFLIILISMTTRLNSSLTQLSLLFNNHDDLQMFLQNFYIPFGLQKPTISNLTLNYPNGTQSLALPCIQWQQLNLSENEVTDILVMICANPQSALIHTIHEVYIGNQ